ncbi:MAG: homocysteine S-methyltransferase family protein, partial [Aestuariivirgaceae bacterium]
VMHNDITLTSEALDVVKRHWSGPIGAYPESGVFKMPNWDFGDIEPEDFVTHCKAWREAGTNIIGGCCGIGPSHIKALKEAFADG